MGSIWTRADTGKGDAGSRPGQWNEGEEKIRNESRLRLQPDRKHEKLKCDKGRRKAESMWGERIVSRT